MWLPMNATILWRNCGNSIADALHGVTTVLYYTVDMVCELEQMNHRMIEHWRTFAAISAKSGD